MLPLSGAYTVHIARLRSLPRCIFDIGSHIDLYQRGLKMKLQFFCTFLHFLYWAKNGLSCTFFLHFFALFLHVLYWKKNGLSCTFLHFLSFLHFFVALFCTFCFLTRKKVCSLLHFLHCFPERKLVLVLGNEHSVTCVCVWSGVSLCNIICLVPTLCVHLHVGGATESLRTNRTEKRSSFSATGESEQSSKPKR